MTLTPELLARIRKAAGAAAQPGPREVQQGLLEVVELMDAAPPTVILALLDRIAELEEAAKATRTRINAALSTLAAPDRVVLTVPEFESMIKRLEAEPK